MYPHSSPGSGGTKTCYRLRFIIEKYFMILYGFFALHGKLNVWYVDHVSFLLDVKIFFMTLFKVAISANNENTGETVMNFLQM